MNCLIRVTVYGMEYGIYTQEAYEELRLQMSTGDFHMHETQVVDAVDVNIDDDLYV